MNIILNKISNYYGKKNVVNFIAHFFVFQIVFFALLGGFIKTHFSVDTYTVFYTMDSLPTMYSIMGRFLTAELFQIFNILNINVVTYQIIFMILGISVCALTAQVFYHALKDILHDKNNFSRILVSIVLCLSIFIGGLALFPELFFPFQISLLCIAIGFLLVTKNKTKLGILFAILSLFIYQVWFPIFIWLFFVHATLIRKINIVKAILYSALIYIVGFASNYGMIKIYSHVKNVNINERANISSIHTVFEQIQYIPAKIYDIFITSFQHFPKYYLISILIILLLFLFFSLFKYKQQFKKNSFAFTTAIAILMAIFIPLIPFLIGKGAWMADRYVLATGTIIGLIYFLFLLLKLNKYIEWSMACFITVIIIAMGINFYKESNLIIITNKFDENLIQKYTNAIEKYENNTGITVTNIQFAKDLSMKYCKVDQCRGTLTLSSFSTTWSDDDAFNYYNRQKKNHFTEINTLNDSFCKQKNWDKYSDEQIIFYGHSALICVF